MSFSQVSFARIFLKLLNFMSFSKKGARVVLLASVAERCLCWAFTSYDRKARTYLCRVGNFLTAQWLSTLVLHPLHTSITVQFSLLQFQRDLKIMRLFFQVMILGHFCLKDRCSILRAVATVGLVAGVILVFEPQNFMVAHYEVVQLLDLPALTMGSAIKSCCTWKMEDK